MAIFKNFFGPAKTDRTRFFLHTQIGVAGDIGTQHPAPGGLATNIWGADLAKFHPNPRTAYDGKTVRVTGQIKTYKDRYEIAVDNPAQIRVKE